MGPGIRRGWKANGAVAFPRLVSLFRCTWGRQPLRSGARLHASTGGCPPNQARSRPAAQTALALELDHAGNSRLDTLLYQLDAGIRGRTLPQDG